MILNEHCRACEFQQKCHAAAVETDDISLLRSLSVGEVESLRERGIFTVKQLSYTFRAKSVTGKSAKPTRHLPALQALAVRENKVYVAHLPTLPNNNETRVFLDVEGIPDRDFYYLIGLIVDCGDQTSGYCFWADDQAEGEGRIWRDLVAVLSQLGKFTLYHYGRYEHEFMNRMLSRYGVPPGMESLAKRLMSNAVDVFAAATGKLYFPTHSRGLKAVGQYLGTSWSDPQASGLRSIVLRYQWEANRDESAKQLLIRYNGEDCAALRVVTNAIEKLIRGAAGDALEVVYPDELPADPKRKFGPMTCANPEIDRLVQCAYFKYQTTKVFFRTDPAVRRSLRRASAPRRSVRVNKVIQCARPERKCLHCGGGPMYLCGKQVYSRLVYDLRFTTAGIHR